MIFFEKISTTLKFFLTFHLPHAEFWLNRVFSCHDGAKLYELRRGLKRTASIFSLSFSPCGAFLACSSNTETVHVFRLVDLLLAKFIKGAIFFDKEKKVNDFSSRLDEGRATEGQVLAGSPPQVIYQQPTTSGMVKISLCNDGLITGLVA